MLPSRIGGGGHAQGELSNTEEMVGLKLHYGACSSWVEGRTKRRRKRDEGRGGISLKAFESTFFFLFLSLGHVHRWFVSSKSE